MKLYSYWRSSSAYRVRIALNLKGLAYDYAPVHLLKDGGEQHAPEYRALNPQEIVPTLVDGDFTLGQSLAIFQYLEATHPQPPLAPRDTRQAARMWAFCQFIACEIQPLQNTRVLQYLSGPLGLSEQDKNAWLRHWIGAGLKSLEAMLAHAPQTLFSFGEAPSYADCCLIPQIYAAQRYGVVPSAYPCLSAVTARCLELPAFQAAHPDRQPDAQRPS